VSRNTLPGGGMQVYSSSHSGAAKNITTNILAGITWFIAFIMLVFLAWVGLQRAGVDFSANPASALEESLSCMTEPEATGQQASLPEFNPVDESYSVTRLASLHTIIPTRDREAITTYEVETGDSVMGIAKKFGLKPESILWANYDLLQDNPNNLSVGQKLKVPPVDGVLYQWKKSDQIENIAHKYKATADDIITWPDNHIDIADPQVAAGTLVMIPNGSRELVQWVVPTVWRANSGASKNLPSGCDTSGGTAVGTGSFGWPADNHSLSGNDFWSGHLGIDIAAATGAPVYASDSGVVVYAGSISGGYGLMVMIDHGNGFHSVYAHNSSILVKCGQNVVKGQVISYAGSTGNSTGPHLHFEIRYNGMFANPWDYLR